MAFLFENDFFFERMGYIILRMFKMMLTRCLCIQTAKLCFHRIAEFCRTPTTMNSSIRIIFCSIFAPIFNKSAVLPNLQIRQDEALWIP